MSEKELSLSIDSELYELLYILSEYQRIPLDAYVEALLAAATAKVKITPKIKEKIEIDKLQPVTDDNILKQRDPNAVLVKVYVTPEEHEKFKRACEKEGVSMSHIIRKLGVAWAIEERKRLEDIMEKQNPQVCELPTLIRSTEYSLGF